MKNLILFVALMVGLAGCQVSASDSSKTIATGEINGKKIDGVIENHLLPGVIIPVGFIGENSEKALFYDTDKNLLILGCVQSISGPKVTFAPC